MLEIFLILIAILYGRCKAYTDALRDYKEQMKLYIETQTDNTFSYKYYNHMWVVGGVNWDRVRTCKLPVFCADAWHYYDGIKYLILSLSMSLGWLAAQGLISSLLFLGSWWIVPVFILYLWVGWWVAGLTFALYYHHYLIDPAHKDGPNVRFFGVWFLIINSIKFWYALPSKA